MRISRSTGLKIKKFIRLRFTFDGALTGGKSTASAFNDSSYYVTGFGNEGNGWIALSFPGWGITATNWKAEILALPTTVNIQDGWFKVDWVGTDRISVRRHANVASDINVTLFLTVYEE